MHTPTAADVGGELSKIDTRIPPDDMHEDLAEVLGRKPVVLIFATPQFCQSRVCGPVVDEAEQVKQTDGKGIAFIHMEIYKGNNPKAGVRPQVEAFHLPSEPWLFVIDRHGIIRTRIEGAWGVPELEHAIREVKQRRRESERQEGARKTPRAAAGGRERSPRAGAAQAADPAFRHRRGARRRRGGGADRGQLEPGKSSGGDANLVDVSQVEGQLQGMPQPGLLWRTRGRRCAARVRRPAVPGLQGLLRRDRPGSHLRPGNGEAKIEFRNFTIISQQSVPAGAAAIAAGEQGRGWNFIELFYRNQGEEGSGYVTDEFLTSIAKGAGVPNLTKWKTDRKSKRSSGRGRTTTEEAATASNSAARRRLPWKARGVRKRWGRLARPKRSKGRSEK